MLMVTPPQVSLWPPMYCFTRPPGLAADVRRRRVRDLVPARDPDHVGERVSVRALDPRVVEHLDARPGARVDAGEIPELVQLVGPRAEEGERRLATAVVRLVVGLEVVPERA